MMTAFLNKKAGGSNFNPPTLQKSAKKNRVPVAVVYTKKASRAESRVATCTRCLAQRPSPPTEPHLQFKSIHPC
jgi:hypothetical protein